MLTVGMKSDISIQREDVKMSKIKQKSKPQRQFWPQFDALQVGSGGDEEAGIIPRPRRKGLLDRYSRQARSAMEGAGY